MPAPTALPGAPGSGCRASLSPLFFPSLKSEQDFPFIPPLFPVRQDCRDSGFTSRHRQVVYTRKLNIPWSLIPPKSNFSPHQGLTPLPVCCPAVQAIPSLLLLTPAAEIKCCIEQKTLFPELATAIEAVDRDVLPDGPWPLSLSLQLRLASAAWGPNPLLELLENAFFNVRAQSAGEKSSLIHFPGACNRSAAQPCSCGNLLLEIPGCSR